MPAVISSPVALIIASVSAGAKWTLGLFWSHPTQLTLDNFVQCSSGIALFMAIPVFAVRFFSGVISPASLGACVGGCFGFFWGALFFGGLLDFFFQSGRGGELIVASLSLPLAGAAGGAVYCLVEDCLLGKGSA